MKLLMKKVGGTPAQGQPAVTELEVEEQVPKKVRNRPLFHVKVTFQIILLFPPYHFHSPLIHPHSVLRKSIEHTTLPRVS